MKYSNVFFSWHHFLLQCHLIFLFGPTFGWPHYWMQWHISLPKSTVLHSQDHTYMHVLHHRFFRYVFVKSGFILLYQFEPETYSTGSATMTWSSTIFTLCVLVAGPSVNVINVRVSNSDTDKKKNVCSVRLSNLLIFFY